MYEYMVVVVVVVEVVEMVVVVKVVVKVAVAIQGTTALACKYIKVQEQATGNRQQTTVTH